MERFPWMVLVMAVALSGCVASKGLDAWAVGILASVLALGIATTLFLLRRTRRKLEEHLEALVKRAAAARETKTIADQARQMVLAKVVAREQKNREQEFNSGAPATGAASEGPAGATTSSSAEQATSGSQAPGRVVEPDTSPLAVDPDLHGRSIDLHRGRLRRHLDGLRRRAFWSFLPGALLCLLSFVGPLESYVLCSRYAGRWEFMLGGSALAAVLLAAGSALLRHDHKIRALVESSQSELHYFDRIKGAMDLAASDGRDTYRTTLKAIVQQLIARSPVLAEKSVGPSKTEHTNESGADGLTATVLAKILADLMKEAHKTNTAGR